MKALYTSLRQAVAFVLAFLLSTGVLAQSSPIGAPRTSIVIRVGQLLDVRSGTYVKALRSTSKASASRLWDLRPMC